MTADELYLAMHRSGAACRGPNLPQQRARLRRFCEALINGRYTRNSDLSRKSGAGKKTIAGWMKLADRLASGETPEPNEPKPSLDKATQTEIDNLQEALRQPTNPAESPLTQPNAPETEKLRNKIATVLTDRLNADHAELKPADLKHLTESLCKVVAGLEAPKQSIQVQVLVGAEGQHEAVRKLTENLEWLDQRGELPAEVEEHFRRKYAPRERNLGGRPISEIPIVDADDSDA